MDIAADNMLAAALSSLGAGRLGEAEALCRPILARYPQHVGALHCMAQAAFRAGRPGEAVPLLRRAVKAQRGDAGLLANLGIVLRAAGKLDEAVKVYRQALSEAPEAGEIWFNLGNALREGGHDGEAEAAYRRALASGNCRFDGAGVHANLGLLLEARGSLIAAAAAHRQAIRRMPDMPEYHYNLGNALRANLDLDEAVLAYGEALRLRPNYPEARLNQSLAFLLQGDFARGLAGYEARLLTSEVQQRGFAQPLWRGEPLLGRTLLLHAEQGLGDTIQFLRYLPLLSARAGSLVVEVDPALHRLAARKIAQDGLSRVRLVNSGDPLSAFDVHIPFMSLPHAFGFDLREIPGPVPYLAADPAAVESWSHRLGADHGLRIGLVWAGNTAHRNDHNRSIKPRALLPLLEAKAAGALRFFSLQVGARARDIKIFPRETITDLSPFLHDFDDTAAAICALDRVICVDTSVAHLAGALGRPVDLLLPYNPDWRWLLDRTDSPWYPTARLHRQAAPGDWAGVVAALVRELKDSVAR
ncbi:glycosyltransferase family protein [Bradyrhizobium manausense]|uniref:tetratricopeptide repeat protein n=1 Tax=Bradyrhizobium manausense TaxID=989370 RepID=UPI001BA4ECCA|nr:tetratricopeptide repeat protein [Bradyrhizobium manausense]MBR1090978.1 glycosyltransferase family protein [Bradyrhizobium manausense]